MTSMGFCWMVVFDWIPVLVALVLIFANTIFSVSWSVNISNTIVDEKTHNRFDLLAAMPPGTSGVSWAMCTGYLHRQASFRWVPFVVRVLSLVLLLTFIAATIISLAIIQDASMTDLALVANTRIVGIALAGIFFVIAFYCDHLYTVIIAALTGMMAPVDVLTGSEARLRALSAFLLVQCLTYVTCWFVVITLPGGLGTHVSVAAVLAQCIISLAFFLALRELTVRLMWNRLVTQLNAGEAEFNTLLVVRPD